MNTNSQYFCQICIFLVFGVASLASIISGQIKYLYFEPVKSDKAFHLLFDGKELFIGKEETLEKEEQSFSSLPSILKPMFFKKIPINYAAKELLLTVPGIGPVLAHEILVVKEKKGKFHDAQDLLAVSGIGTSKMNHFNNYFSYE